MVIIMKDTLSIKYNNVEELSRSPLQLRTDLVITLNNQVYTFNDILIIEFYTFIKEWLHDDYITEFSFLKSDESDALFSISSNENETWTFASNTIKEPIDIDEFILELWKFTVQLEVDVKEQLNVDLLENESK